MHAHLTDKTTMQFASIQWNKHQPYSLDFDDIYYSDDGLAETEYVFIQHNQLTDRFANLTADTFTIIETGFGTGLNFFCAVQQFLALAPKDATLKFISTERYPLTLQDFILANQHWAIFDDYVAELANAYAQLSEGLNRLMCGHGRIQLELWIGDINDTLPAINTSADAWFLDGFAPSKNSDMWSDYLFSEIARLSKPNATFSTFTSAGKVKRGLQAVGFEVTKTKGFGKKREMLCGGLHLPPI